MLILFQVNSAHCQQILEGLCRSDFHLTGRHDSLCASMFRWTNPGFDALILQIDSLDSLLADYFLQPGNEALDETRRLAHRKLRELYDLILVAESPNNSGQNEVHVEQEPIVVQPLHTFRLSGFRSDTNDRTEHRELPVERAAYVESENQHIYPQFPAASALDHWKLELGCGFTRFFSKPEEYYVDRHGGIETIRTGGGFNLLLSAHCTYALNTREAILMSLPIVTLSGQSEAKIGLLGKRLASGLGYQRSMGPVAAYIALLTAPFEYYDEDLLSAVQVDAEPHSKADLDEYPSSVKYHLITSFGLSFPLYVP